MVKAELGSKRTCVACGAKFYDLGRTPAVCPKCDTEQPAEQPRLRRAAAPLPDDKLKKRVVPGDADADADEAEVDDAAEDAGDDVEEIDDAEEDLNEEIGVTEEGDEEN